MLSLPGEKPCVADPTNRASLPIERAHIPQRSLRSALKRRCTMKPVLMLAFLLTVPVTYAANAKPTEVGCNKFLRTILSGDDGPSARAQRQVTNRPSRCSPARETRRQTCRWLSAGILWGMPAVVAPQSRPLPSGDVRQTPHSEKYPRPSPLPHTSPIPPRTKGSISRRPASRAGRRSGTRAVTRGATARGSPHPPGESPGAGFR